MKNYYLRSNRMFSWLEDDIGKTVTTDAKRLYDADEVDKLLEEIHNKLTNRLIHAIL